MERSWLFFLSENRNRFSKKIFVPRVPDRAGSGPGGGLADFCGGRFWGSF